MSDCNSNEGCLTTNGNVESSEGCDADADCVVTAAQLSSPTNLLNENEKNSISVVCQFCDSKVLTPDVATFRRLDGHFLPAMRQKKMIATSTSEADSQGNNQRLEGDNLDDFWLVEDMFHFENVGFSKAVNNVKYLICADCEMGPIGFHDPAAPKEFYVALTRVQHK